MSTEPTLEEHIRYNNKKIISVNKNINIHCVNFCQAGALISNSSSHSIQVLCRYRDWHKGRIEKCQVNLPWNSFYTVYIFDWLFWTDENTVIQYMWKTTWVWCDSPFTWYVMKCFQHYISLQKQWSKIPNLKEYRLMLIENVFLLLFHNG